MIAVVDDDASVRRALKRLLVSAGHAVKAYTSGAAFLQTLNHGLPTCVLLDLDMPQVDGFEVLASLAKLRAHVPVLVITANRVQANVAQAKKLGALACLRKPVDETALLQAIEAALRSRN